MGVGAGEEVATAVVAATLDVAVVIAGDDGDATGTGELHAASSPPSTRSPRVLLILPEYCSGHTPDGMTAS